MKTPRFFSHPIAGKLLPEVLGNDFQAKAEPICLAADYRCQISYYNYKPAHEGDRCWLMLEPRDFLGGKGAERRPATSEQVTKAFKTHGINAKTTQAIDPLLYWARHTDLAVMHRRGTLIFAPWITQGELLSLFRCATIGAIQPNFAGAESARRILDDIEVFGNDEIMREATATSTVPEPWSTLEWLKGVRKLPVKERRSYLNEFGSNLRFWPDHTVFRPVIESWRDQVNAHVKPPESDSGNPWFNHYFDTFKKLNQKQS